LNPGAGGGSERYSFSQTDIMMLLAAQFSEFRPDIVMHLAEVSGPFH
jgi:dTDP-glucose 4,6-dehydratase